MAKATNWDHLPLNMSVPELQEALGFSRNKAYEIAHTCGIRVGKLLKVPRKRLRQWLEDGVIEENAPPPRKQPVGGRYLPPLVSQLRESWEVTNNAKQNRSQ